MAQRARPRGADRRHRPRGRGEAVLAGGLQHDHVKQLKKSLVAARSARRRARARSSRAGGACSTRTTRSASGTVDRLLHRARRQDGPRLQARGIARVRPPRPAAGPRVLQQPEAAPRCEAPRGQPRSCRSPPDAHRAGSPDDQERRQGETDADAQGAPGGARRPSPDPVGERRHGAIDFPAADRLVRHGREPSTGNERHQGDEDDRESGRGRGRGARRRRTGQEDVDEVLSNLQTQLNNARRASSVRTEKVRDRRSPARPRKSRRPRGSTWSTSPRKVLDEDLYGGLIKSESEDINARLRRFDVEQHLVARWQGDRVENVPRPPRRGTDAGVEFAISSPSLRRGADSGAPVCARLAVEPLVVAAQTDGARPRLPSSLGLRGAHQALCATSRRSSSGWL